MFVKKIKYILVLLIFLCINITCGCYIVDCKYSEELIQTINEDDEVRFEYLISKKGNLDSKPYVFGIDRVNLPPLHYACKMGKYEYVVKLIAAGADVNNVNHPIKFTPLMVTLDSNNENKFEIARYLVESGADVNIEVAGTTAIEQVFTYNPDNQDISIKEEYEFALYLINNGADIELGTLGNVVFAAARTNNVLMVKHLIENMQVDINMQDLIVGNTPLMWAVKIDCYDVVKYLLDKGANIELVNKDGKTARDIALENVNYKILELLSEKN